MEKLKSTLPNMVGVLTTVAVLCGGLLALVNNVTQAFFHLVFLTYLIKLL